MAIHTYEQKSDPIWAGVVFITLDKGWGKNLCSWAGWEGDLSKELSLAATEASPKVSDHGCPQERSNEEQTTE